MLPRSDQKKRVHPDCPDGIRRQVDIVLATSLSGKAVYRDETLADVVDRYCPEIFLITAEHGFDLRFDMPENTHKAITKGRMFYQIRRKLLS